MTRARVLVVAAALSLMPAQAPSRVDFARDVQPILRQYCVSCHGPSQQMNGFRLDRRRDAMRGGTIAVIGPGNADGSRLYQRLIGSRFGKQMPPTGALDEAKVAIIKAWIDQGAEWPDALSGEIAAPPPDARAVGIMHAFRAHDRGALERLWRDPTLANLKGTGGTTPLMSATLYGSAADVRRLLQAGADPNVPNQTGATPLMWAVDDLEKTRALLDAGADPNARSDDGRTPVIIASGRYGAAPIVNLLLEYAADATASGIGTNALIESAYAGDEAILRLLVEYGADVKASAVAILLLGTETSCAACVDLALKQCDDAAVKRTIQLLTPPTTDGRAVAALLDRVREVPGGDPDGNTLLIHLANSDAIPIESVKAAIAHGADVNAKSAAGQDALGLARLRGETSIVDALLKAGASNHVVEPVHSTPRPAASAREAVARSLPLLQRSDVSFLKKSGCVSCHHNSLTAMSVSTARAAHLPIDAGIAGDQLKAIGNYVDGWRERLLQYIGIPGDHDSVSYLLLGLAAERYPADETTDAMARYLMRMQRRDGSWMIIAHRPPIESSDIEVTAAAMRAIQLYGAAWPAERDRSIARATQWLSTAQPVTTEERAFHVLGLHWARAPREAIATSGRRLIDQQHSDGGWPQLATMASDAYATGQALFALSEAGLLKPGDRVFVRGVEYLRNTQLEDGSWHVTTRAFPLQPLFESGFPHGRDQWISVAATNWATIALSRAARQN